MEHQRIYSALPPEEVIAEEEYPESPRTNTSGDGYVLMNPQDPHQNDYTYMGGPHGASNSASTSSVTSGTPSTEMKSVGSFRKYTELTDSMSFVLQMFGVPIGEGVLLRVHQ